jgi:hypothetical protein
VEITEVWIGLHNDNFSQTVLLTEKIYYCDPIKQDEMGQSCKGTAQKGNAYNIVLQKPEMK